jgi:hypothetical protein
MKKAGCWMKNCRRKTPAFIPAPENVFMAHGPVRDF